MKKGIITVTSMVLLSIQVKESQAEYCREGFEYEKLDFIPVPKPELIREVDHVMRFNKKKNRIKRRKRPWWTSADQYTLL